MKIYAFEEAGGPARESTVATPRPSGHEVLLRLTHSGVCHSDVHIRDNPDLPFPVVAGHEMAGEVVAVGEDVTTTKPGDVRLVFPWLGCGTCQDCRAGNDDRCPDQRPLGVTAYGGYAEMVHIPHERYLLDITGIDTGWAATLACSGLTAYAAVSKVLRGDPDDEIVVLGTGGVGLTAVAVLRALGHRRVTAVDVNAERLAMARELGAAETVDSSAEGALEALCRVTGGGAVGVVDFVNSGTTARLAFDALRRDGKLVQVGLFGGELTLPTALMPVKRLTLQGSYVGTLTELREVVELARSGRLPRTPLVTRPLTAEGVNTSLDDLAKGAVPGRIVLTA
ncbi:alcohol dehydrogenase [Streptomyces europaeiscabiei]|uniref:alcohol dehydrogenase n=1 Tax=Streptomyces europaeiscabiei TaxID=146819 RepID=UPI002E0EA953|nr:alcohol dehydrogenase [Streptomyces europaeiscabiei]